jgi:nitrate reductase gamma subunit
MKKTSALFGIGLSIIFVIIGLSLITKKTSSIEFLTPATVKVVGVVCVTFFGSITLIGLYKFLKR